MATRQGMPKAAPEPAVDWEDKYRRLYEKHNALKVIRADQDEQIKKLNTSIRKLENMNTQIIQQQRIGGGGTVFAYKILQSTQLHIPFQKL